MSPSHSNGDGGRVAVVTGASSGIGRATALWLGAAGAKVLANARGEQRLAALRSDWKGLPDGLALHAGDVGAAGFAEQLLSAAQRRFGQPADLVVVNAGRGLAGSVLTSDASQWDEVIGTNLLGAMHLMRAAGAQMKARREAETSPAPTPMDIVVIGSTVGRHISPFSSAYGSTKFAVASLAEAMRRELAALRIRVTLVEPGIVSSGFQDVAGYDQQWHEDVTRRFGPLLSGEDIANVIGFIISQPPHVHVNNVVVRPTRQDYP